MALLADLTPLGGPLAAASFVAGVAGATALSDTPYPRPGSSPEQVRRYFTGNAGAARLSIAGQLLSAASLGVFAASVVKLAQGSGALQTAAAVGGTLSVATLGASAVTSARLTAGKADDPETALKLHDRAFLAGGTLHGPAIGLLVGALGLTALRGEELPRGLAIACLATAVAGVLTPLSLVLKPAVWLIPASRFPGLLLSALAGVLLWKRAR